MAFEDEARCPGPLGFFDPLGLVADEIQESSTASVETANGRVSMLAVVGYLVQKLASVFRATT
jgi:hypothetical protein